MIPVPRTERSGLNTAPWFALVLLLGYLLVHFTVQQGEQTRQQELARWYQQSGLFTLEWNNYISWLRISGQIPKAEKLETVRANEDQLALFRAMAFDPAFERENIVRGTQYWSEAEFNRWREAREQFKQQATALPTVRWGLNPAEPRPSTYVSWHFLNDSLWQIALTALVLLPLAWAIEGTLGTLRALGATLLGGMLIALVYVALFRNSYVPVTGSTPIAALWCGMLLGLFRFKKIPCRFWHPTQKRFTDILLPSALFALPAAGLLAYEIIGGSTVPWAEVLLVSALPIGAGLAWLIEPKTVAQTPSTEESSPSETIEPDASKQYRQILTQAWAAMGILAFKEAEQGFLKAHALAPAQLNPVSGLFHLAKTDIHHADFSAICEKLWRAEPGDAGEVKQWILLLREQARLTQEHPLNMNDEIRAHLISTLSHHGEALEADKYAQTYQHAENVPDTVRESLRQLADAHEHAGNSSRASQWRTLTQH